MKNSKKPNPRPLDKVLFQLFVNRTDTFAAQKKDGTYRSVRKPVTEEVLKQHLNGEKTIGCYQINPADNSVKWICFDIDPERITEATEVALKIFEQAKKSFGEKAVLLEASRHPDPSYHIWVFLEHSIPAYTARYLGKKILKICKLEKTSIELFPKQDTVSKGGFGNLVKLPLGIHRKCGKRSCFLNPEKMEPVPNEVLNDIEAAACEEEIYRVFCRTDAEKTEKTASVLADYWLNFCHFDAGKVWSLLEQWNKTDEPSLMQERLIEVMQRANKSHPILTEDNGDNRRTDFQQQIITLEEKADIFDIPCIKTFRDNSILPCGRHDILGKNFSILYQKIRGSFQGFEDFATSVTKNQLDFDERSLDWRKWVQSKPRSFSCIEVRNFLGRHIPGFSCNNCPLEVKAYYVHPAGGLNEFFVYEPIGQHEYVYRTVDGKRGICKVRKDEKKCFLLIEGQKFFFKQKLPDSWFFHIPEKDTIQKWVDGSKNSKPLTQLWKDIQVGLQTFLDIPNRHEFSALALFAVQSWISEFSGTVFYCGIQGEFGGGKTVCGETAIQMCRHGYHTGNLTPAFLARSIEKQKLTLFVDELDSVAGIEDSDLYQIFRQGYRRGGSYSRVNPKTMETETFLIFGPKIFSLHSSVEPALQSRTLTVHVRETDNPQFPVIGGYRDKLVRKIHDDLFLWYLDNALEIRNIQPRIDAIKVDTVDQVALPVNGIDQQTRLENISNKAEKLREELFKQSTGHLSEGQLHQLSQLKGRNVELAHIMMTLSNLVEIDITDDVAKIFEQKITEESDPLEIGPMGILKDVLVDIWNEKSEDDNYLTDTGYVKISNKELYDRYNTALKGGNYLRITTHEFKAYLTEFGFSDTLNRKKMKILIPDENTPQSRLCNIFTPRVLKKLGIETEESSDEDNSTGNNEQRPEEGNVHTEVIAECCPALTRGEY